MLRTGGQCQGQKPDSHACSSILSIFPPEMKQLKMENNSPLVKWSVVRYLYRLAGVAAVVGEDGGDGLQDLAGVSPGHHQAEEAGAGQRRDGLARRVVGPRAPDRGLQQQLEKRLWREAHRWRRGAG